ncbi:MAG: N-acetylneuraminate synthase [Deltaproteobacteria bacterium]|nr:N-acetylneuraminate synthase [Deltaproteobacteria bacterium]MCL4873367.1 N-acetylneuraminate synthase [bacterium]
MSIFIIAEAGVNHNGSMENALQMVDAAAEAGADAIKFQTFSAERVVTRRAEKAAYQVNTTKTGPQLEMLKRYELDEKMHLRLIERCRERGIRFLSTPFDLKSIELLSGLGLDILKIPSGEITNLPYLRKVGGLGKKVLLSTGMSEMGEVRAAIEALALSGTPKGRITALHCTTEYPTPMEDANLRAMATMREALDVRVGYSDHTPGIEAALAAAALGAEVIEKHFTLDKTMEGPDHRASLEPGELKAMVLGIRKVEKALGDGVKRPARSEAANITALRKSIVAARAIRKGETLSEEAITAKRPGSGLSPMLWDRVVGAVAMRDFAPDELIEAEV